MGLFIALLIMICWTIHLIYTLIFQPINFLDYWLYIHIIIQTWLSTGLFITAHDAMHRTVSTNKSTNYMVGFISSFLFAGMYYPQLIRKHQLHHQFPGTVQDPDYKMGKQDFFNWWFSFMKQYITIWQILIMAIIFNVLMIWFNELQLLTLWVFPSILATFKLFYFGTYCPHKLPHTTDMLPHNSRSLSRNHLWAFLSCYFFGYHFEHHASPQTPWWKLYQTKQ
jgi:beta-carotene/zeaxanthin 4-ketolase